MFNSSRETLLDFSNGIASFLKNSEYFATSVENRANLSNLGSDNLAGCKCFFYEVSAVHNITLKILDNANTSGHVGQIKEVWWKEEFEKNCKLIGHSASKLLASFLSSNVSSNIKIIWQFKQSDLDYVAISGIIRLSES